MTVAVLSFTEAGAELSCRVKEKIDHNETAVLKDAGWNRKIELILYTKCKALYDGKNVNWNLDASVSYVEDSLQSFAEKQFENHYGIVFIGACGIAVRAIAPSIQDKLTDSPVLVMDEKGQFVIPVLSGHAGGANELAKCLADCLGAIPVITTATDVQNRFAVDLFAKKNHLQILNREGIAVVSAKVLAGEKICMALKGCSYINGRIPEDIELVETEAGEQKRNVGLEGKEREREKCETPEMVTGEQILCVEPEAGKQTVDVWICDEPYPVQDTGKKASLYLRPKRYIVGIGCKKGKTFEELDAMLFRTLYKMGLNIEDVAAFTSIDVKKEEPGLRELGRYYRIPFLTYSAEVLRLIPGDFLGSLFVENTVGVDNVCARSAMAACKEGGELVMDKQAENGITMAVAKRMWGIEF